MELIQPEIRLSHRIAVRLYQYHIRPHCECHAVIMIEFQWAGDAIPKELGFEWHIISGATVDKRNGVWITAVGNSILQPMLCHVA